MEHHVSDALTTRPFPALTIAQRYHFDLYGYCVVPSVLSASECQGMIDALRQLREDLRAANANLSKDEPPRKVKGARFEINSPHHTFMSNFYEYDDRLLNYACHPRLVGMAEEVMGCEARITELNGHLNTRLPGDIDPNPRFGFHAGAEIRSDSHIVGGLYHCSFVKTLTTLVDLGPDDGGTVVIAGSHKIQADREAIYQLAYADRSLIHQFVAPAGSTLLFAETLIHATGQVRSDIERAIMITGYGPTMFPRWDLYDEPAAVAAPPYSQAFMRRIPEQLKSLLLGRLHWDRKARYRALGDAVDDAPRTAVVWPTHDRP
jgi:hypothetical protein